MEKYHWALNFDFSEEKLANNYHNSRSYAWIEIRNFLEDNNFYHRQKSGYHTTEKMASHQIQYLTIHMHKTFPWLKECADVADFTVQGDHFDALEFIKNNTETLEQNDVNSSENDIDFDLDFDPFGGTPDLSDTNDNSLNFEEFQPLYLRNSAPKANSR